MWYKLSQISKQKENLNSINNFTDRNHINSQIRDLEELVEKLIYAGEIAQQTQQEAQKIAQSVLSDKKISSFPIIMSDLGLAINRVKDNPKHFSALCLKAADQLTDKIYKLVKMREEFAFGTKNVKKVRKGLF
jgi:inosine/xanthosine triphosphate pyrophosphatase family protein